MSRPLKDGLISKLDGASDLTTPLARLVIKASLIFRSGMGGLSKTLTYLGENAWMMANISSRSKASTRISAKIFFIFLVKLDIGAADLMIANLLVFSEWRNTIVKSSKKYETNRLQKKHTEVNEAKISLVHSSTSAH